MIITEVKLEKQAYEFAQRFDLHKYLEANLTVREYWVNDFKEQALHAFVEMFTETLADEKVIYPTTWVDAFKDRWFPEWALNRWPVNYTVEHYRAEALYPRHAIAAQEKDTTLFIASVESREVTL